MCIPVEEYDAIFVHDLDSNCQPVADTGDGDGSTDTEEDGPTGTGGGDTGATLENC